MCYRMSRTYVVWWVAFLLQRVDDDDVPVPRQQAAIRWQGKSR